MIQANALIDTFLQTHLDNYLQEIVHLCAQPSVSATGEGIEACADLTAQLLQKHQFQVQKFTTPGNPILVAQARGQSDQTLLFYNHYDVQPPEPLELWTSPPFSPTIREGALYARGAADDKGEIVARLAAVDAVRQAHGGTLPCNVICVIEGEEETSSAHIPAFVEAHRDLLAAQGAIWEVGGIEPDGSPVVILGLRGILGVELSVEVMRHDAHSGNAHVLPNAAWRLIWALNSLKGPDEHILIPGFYEGVIPPSRTEQELLNALPNTEGTLREIYGAKAFVRGVTGNAFKQAVFEPTCTVEGLTAGYQGPGGKTVIPASASAKLDFRLVPNQAPADILAKLRNHLDQQGFTDVHIQPLGQTAPAKTAVDSPFVKLVAEMGTEVYGKQSLINPMIGGSGPMHAFGEPLGNLPIVCAGIQYWNNQAHAPNEHIRISDFLNGTRHIARILNGFADL